MSKYKEDIDEIVVGLLAIKGHIKLIRKSLGALHADAEAAKNDTASLPSGEAEGLTEVIRDLKMQMQEMRELLTPYGRRDSADNELEAELTQEEINALLHSSLNDISPKESLSATDISEVKKELSEIKEAILALSEVVERHEDVLAKIKGQSR